MLIFLPDSLNYVNYAWWEKCIRRMVKCASRARARPVYLISYTRHLCNWLSVSLHAAGWMTVGAGEIHVAATGEWIQGHEKTKFWCSVFVCDDVQEKRANGGNPRVQMLTVSLSQRALWRRRRLGIGHQSGWQGGRTVGDEWTQLMLKRLSVGTYSSQTLIGTATQQPRRVAKKKQIHIFFSLSLVRFVLSK